MVGKINVPSIFYQIGEKVFSAINNQAYEVEKVMNHQGEWIGVKEVKNDG